MIEYRLDVINEEERPLILVELARYNLALAELRLDLAQCNVDYWKLLLNERMKKAAESQGLDGFREGTSGA